MICECMYVMVCFALACLCEHGVVNLRNVRDSYDGLFLPECTRTEKPLRPFGVSEQVSADLDQIM